MTTEQKAPDPRMLDWFVPAILADGSVGDCLDAVIERLEQQRSFVAALKANLCIAGTSIDRITGLADEIRRFEGSLRVRLGILRPDREGAWFREPSLKTGGPFAVSVRAEPVFASFNYADPSVVKQVRAELVRLWEARAAAPLPFRDNTPCLWGAILELNARWDQIAVLGAPFVGMRLDRLPETLLPSLESPSLRAFLIRVRGALMDARQKLDACHQILDQATQGFWLHCEKRSTSAKVPPQQPLKPKEAAPQQGASQRAAQELREEFRKRRQSARRVLPIGPTRQALKFMGFEDVPDAEELKRRYLQLAKALHPDRKGGSEDAFKMLNDAYTLLTERLGAAPRL